MTEEPNPEDCKVLAQGLYQDPVESHTEPTNKVLEVLWEKEDTYWICGYDFKDPEASKKFQGPMSMVEAVKKFSFNAVPGYESREWLDKTHYILQRS